MQSRDNDLAIDTSPQNFAENREKVETFFVNFFEKKSGEGNRVKLGQKFKEFFLKQYEFHRKMRCIISLLQHLISVGPMFPNLPITKEQLKELQTSYNGLTTNFFNKNPAETIEDNFNHLLSIINPDNLKFRGLLFAFQNWLPYKEFIDKFLENCEQLEDVTKEIKTELNCKSWSDVITYFTVPFQHLMRYDYALQEMKKVFVGNKVLLDKFEKTLTFIREKTTAINQNNEVVFQLNILTKKLDDQLVILSKQTNFSDKESISYQLTEKVNEVIQTAKKCKANVIINEEPIESVYAELMEKLTDLNKLGSEYIKEGYTLYNIVSTGCSFLTTRLTYFTSQSQSSEAAVDFQFLPEFIETLSKRIQESKQAVTYKPYPFTR